jgi:hypothetical protein
MGPAKGIHAMFRKQYSFSDSDPRAESRMVLPSTGSLLINHEEEVLEGEAGVFEKLAAWDAETVLRFRAFLSRNGAAIAFFEEPLRGIKDRKKRRFETITAAVAHFAEFYEQQKRADGGAFTQNGLLARWERTFVP